MRLKEKCNPVPFIIYFIINILFITPIILFSVMSDFFNNFFDSIGFVPSVYAVLMIIYHMFKLTYVHMILCILFLVFYIKKILKDKKILYLVVIFADISVNVLWQIFGWAYMVQ